MQPGSLETTLETPVDYHEIAVYAVRTSELTKDFGDFRAVERLSLAIPRGVFYGFLGPNGAGKSTTIKMLTGLLAPTYGSIEILGLKMAERPNEVKKHIGVVPEDMALFDRLTGSEYLVFVGRMYGLARQTAVRRAAELLEFMDLQDEPKKLIADYSHGMKKKISLASALIHTPKLLFLDEPFEGVDALAAKTMKKTLLSMIERGATIFLTSHVLDIVERLCSHVGIINHGKLVAQGSLDELRAGVHTDEYTESAGEGRKLTLEELFVRIVGGDEPKPEHSLAWLTE
ncbi:MAG TPA: ABC transporter ATP-binding protein [Blastocatellia bacterium]|nr:ABC transporter ATP-binding protein [Blastocatellia bacterium]